MYTKEAPAPNSKFKLDKNGAPILSVEFLTDRWDIPPAYTQQLNAFGSYLKDNPNTLATLAGYADLSGHGPANTQLAQKRADAVQAYLSSHYGISVQRIKAEGYGMVTDKIRNSTAEAKQVDRRVYGTISQLKS
jgi:OOP family OmpA-OmpF porin